MVNLAEIYPFEPNYMQVGGFGYHYVDEGEGEAVVMVHGNPSWSFLYRDLISSFSDRYRMIAPDHIGCGLSDKPASSEYDYTLEQRVEDFAKFIDKLQVKTFNLVVHDWGGMIGLAYAVRHPERIRRLILFNTAAFPLPNTKKLPLSIALCRNAVFGRFLVQGLNAFCLGAARFCTVEPLPAKVRAGFLYPYQDWRSRGAIYQFVRDIPLKADDPAFALLKETANGLDRLKHVPSLILWGKKDFVFDEHFLKEWQKRWPEAEVHAFADAGHYVIEDAKQKIMPLVADFLQGQAARH